VTPSTESLIRIADDWLESHRVSESWRIINGLRDALVRGEHDGEPGHCTGCLAATQGAYETPNHPNRSSDV